MKHQQFCDGCSEIWIPIGSAIVREPSSETCAEKLVVYLFEWRFENEANRLSFSGCHLLFCYSFCPESNEARSLKTDGAFEGPGSRGGLAVILDKV